MNSVHNKKNGPSGNRTRLSTLRGSRTKPIFDGTKKYSEKSENETKKAEQKKCSALVPHGGFEPPQSEPESDVLPLHKRGMGEFNIHFFGVSVNAVGKEINYHRPLGSPTASVLWQAQNWCERV